MKTKFDKIYCLHLADNLERLEHLEKEILKINLELKVDIWWTTKRDISNTIGLNLTQMHTSYYDQYQLVNDSIYGNVFNCAFEHYTIIKQAYERGFKSILILEDDIEFIDDIDLIERYLNELPEDYDIIRYQTSNMPLIGNQVKDNHMFILNSIKQLFSTLCYAVSRNGMKIIIDQYNKKFEASDVVLNNILESTKYKFYTASRYICHPSNFNSTII